MDTAKNISIPATMYFDTIIYFYMLALSVHEGDEVVMLDPEEFLRETEVVPTERLERLDVNFFTDFKSAQKRFQLSLANSMVEMTGMWVEQLSCDVHLFKEFNRYALEKYGLNLPIEFRGERPSFTLVLNKQ